MVGFYDKCRKICHTFAIHGCYGLYTAWCSTLSLKTDPFARHFSMENSHRNCLWMLIKNTAQIMKIAVTSFNQKNKYCVWWSKGENDCQNSPFWNMELLTPFLPLLVTLYTSVQVIHGMQYQDTPKHESWWKRPLIYPIHLWLLVIKRYNNMTTKMAIEVRTPFVSSVIVIETKNNQMAQQL